MSMKNMGKPISCKKKDNAIKELMKFGCTKTNAEECVEIVSSLLKEDKPNEAMKESQKYIDSTGSYMLFAFLLT